MHSLKVKALYDHVDFFRDLVNGRLAKGPKEEKSFSEYAKRSLKLNDEKDWNVICSGMDMIGDTSLSLDHFLRFGMEGVSRYNEVGEKYLRLYGALNSTYIQQEAFLLFINSANSQNSLLSEKDWRSLKYVISGIS
ncbi:hypothetical protein ACQKFL_20540 [Vreelandella titanicae]|uniref:hypothetical protein n=1 Tax=Vreelandella titanicae TaxID=664683 RepID=UPI003D03113E